MATYNWAGTDIIPNGNGSAVRADLNDALLALFSQNSNATAPTTTVGYMLWADSNAGYLKIRDSSNPGLWYNLFTLTGEWSPLKLVNGTAAYPSLQFTSSGTDTGLYSPGTDQVAITTAGVQRVNFNGSTEVVFNDGGADVDFRIEGDTKPNLFKVDAGTDTVSVDGTFTALGASTLNGGSGLLNRGIMQNPTAPVFTPTTVEFLGIPTWAKRVTLVFRTMSCSSSDHFLVQLGTSYGFEVINYIGNTNILLGGSSSAGLTSGLGAIMWGGGTANSISGSVVAHNIGGNLWVITGQYMFDNIAGYTCWTTAQILLANPLTSIRLALTAAGTFDAGNINVFYEG
jgi:hypothetical protein